MSVRVVRLVVAAVVAISGVVVVQASPAAADGYKLPWAAGNWNVTQGRHASTGGNAWDFQPPGAGSHNDEVLAVASGTAKVICTDASGQATVSLTVGGDVFKYVHLQASAVSAAGVSSAGVTVQQGQVLGRLLPSSGSFGGTCGYGSASHLHFEMPRVPFTLDGVTFSAAGPNGITSIHSTNVRNTGGPPPASDSDGDGLTDPNDRCPYLGGEAIWSGCRENLLRNASLEEGSTAGWSVLGPGTTNVAAYENPSAARDGEWHGDTNVSQAGGSIHQDVPINPGTGDSFTASVWLKSTSSAKVTLSLWAVGGNQQAGNKTATIGTRWTRVAVPLDVREGAHTSLRFQIYQHSPGVGLRFDSAVLTRNLLRNGSLEEGGSTPWHLMGPGTTNLVAYKNASAAHGGEWYAETNVSQKGGSIYQDIAVSPASGESYTMSMWVRSSSTKTARLGMTLWAVGGNSQSTSSVRDVGPTWTELTATLDVRENNHGLIRAQLYQDTPGVSVRFDDVKIVRNGLRNASLEEGSSVGWGVLGPGTTNIAAYKNAARAAEGEWYGESNVSQSGGSFHQDVPVSPNAGESFNGSVWLRSATSKPINATLTLWAVGGNQQAGNTNVTLGPRWTLVSVPLDVRENGHTSLRLQVYQRTPGRSIQFDSAQIDARPTKVDVSAPAVRMTAPGSVTRKSTVRVRWAGSDTQSGVAYHTLKRRYRAKNGTWSNWSAPSAWARLTTTAVTSNKLAKGRKYCYSVRARDYMGNLSAWSASKCVARK